MNIPMAIAVAVDTVTICHGSKCQIPRRLKVWIPILLQIETADSMSMEVPYPLKAVTLPITPKMDTISVAEEMEEMLSLKMVNSVDSILPEHR